jgi:hypothetical protein
MQASKTKRQPDRQPVDALVASSIDDGRQGDRGGWRRLGEVVARLLSDHNRQHRPVPGDDNRPEKVAGTLGDAGGATMEHRS